MSEETTSVPTCVRSQDSASLLLTVAICTRNRAAFLREAVESVLPQLDKNTEILIVDNLSEDATPEVARAFAARHARIREIREAELGLSAARNAALREARGTFVVFLDDDATAEPGWVEAYSHFFWKLPAQRSRWAGDGSSRFTRRSCLIGWYSEQEHWI